ncbi:MAG: hypothetical protein F4201_00555, partial [Nitrospira sp. SB0677_bin_15]|nr:hypothetical protein [Nitrospira sp. SB0677_bin_15]
LVDDDAPPPTPVVSIAGGPAVTEGGTATFTLSASPTPAGAIAVEVEVADSGDFTVGGQTGVRTVTVGTDGTGKLTIATVNDGADEANGTLVATVRSGDGYAPHDSDSTAEVAVADDDDPVPAEPVVSIAGGSEITEGGTASFTLTATPAPSDAITVSVTVADSGAFASSGQTGSRTVTIGTSGSASLAVTTDPDSRDEPDGTITATVVSGTGYTVDSQHGADRVAVKDDDVPVASFASATSNPAESAGTQQVTIDLAPAPATALTLAYTLGGTAGEGQGHDFTIANRGLVAVPAGATTATISVAIIDDSTAETAETVILTLTAGEGYTLSSPTLHTLTIADNDAVVIPPGVTLSTSALDLDEGGTAGAYTVVLNRAPTADVTVTATSGDANTVKVHGLGGTAGGYAVLTFTPINWATAHTVTVTPQDDRDSDDESVTITHVVSNTGGYGNVTAGAVTVRVDDDDAVPPSVVSACVSDELLATAERLYERNRHRPPAYAENWFSVLVAFGVRSPADWTADHRPISPMTAASARARDWRRFATALACLEGAPPAGPVVRVTAGAAVTEGSPATFTLSASPAPTSALTVSVAVADSGAFAGTGQTGVRSVTIGTDGTGSLTVTTVDDQTDEPNGAVKATVQAGTGYVPHDSAGAATVAVADNDAPPAVPVVRVTAGAAVTEGSPATFTLSANPAPTSALTVSVAVADSGTFAGAGQTGVRSVTIGTAGTGSLTVTTVNDSTDEPNGSVKATVQAGSGYVPHDSAGAATVAVADNDAPPPVPVVRVTGGAAVTEGSPATFTLSASPAPTSALTVSVAVTDSGTFAGAGQTGVRSVTIGTAGTGSLTVTTVNDSTDEPNGSVKA